MSDENYLRWGVRGSIISRLGSEQLKDEITAVMELVKNAYDADAKFVKIEFIDSAGEKEIKIQDDGSGMTIEDLKTNWAFLATENKLREPRSPLLKRRRLGQKGVGRFATEKLGKMLILKTRVAGESKIKQVIFDWDLISGEKELTDYKHLITEKKPGNFEPEKGTCLHIKKLRANWIKKKIEKLRNQLCTLIDPDSAASDFKIFIQTPWEDINGELKNPLPGNETHKLDFDLGNDGTELIILNTEGSQKKAKSKPGIPSFGPIRGCLRYYGKGLKTSERSRGDSDSDWNMGVRIFRDGCRVRPYGEIGSEGDWLQIYRTKYYKGGKQFRLKPNYLEGAIHISTDLNPVLRDTTSREGIEENDAFRDLVGYVQNKVLELSDIVGEEEVKEERRKNQERYKKVLEPLTAALNTLHSNEYKKAVKEWDEERKKQLVRPNPPASEIHNAHWECLDCLDSWKAPIGETPIKCREYSVGRDGKPTYKQGCGSTNIRRKENLPLGTPPQKENYSEQDDILAGIPAYISDIRIKPIIDREMGENDDEAEIRPDQRELAINSRHKAFRSAEMLDGEEKSESATIEILKAKGALTMHIINAASYAWGVWHYKKGNKDINDLLNRYSELKDACIKSLHGFQGDSQSKVK